MSGLGPLLVVAVGNGLVTKWFLGEKFPEVKLSKSKMTHGSYILFYNPPVETGLL